MTEINEIFSSVVMPLHNGQKYLNEAIQSVLNQTYANFEFLIIENCSNDLSVEIVKSYNDPRIRLIVEENCGQVQAYNRGFREAKGEIIFIHDHDDISHSQRFEKQLSKILSTNSDICGSNFNIISDKGNIIAKIELPLSDIEIKEELLFKNFTVFNSSVAIKKKVLEELKYFDIYYFPSADYEFYLRAISNYIFTNIPEILYSWRKHNAQISQKKKLATSQLTIDLSKTYQKKYLDKELNLFLGLTYYYNNKFLKSIYFLIKEFLFGIISKRLLRYLVIIIFFGPIIKISEKLNFPLSNQYQNLKFWFYKIFRKVL